MENWKCCYCLVSKSPGNVNFAVTIYGGDLVCQEHNRMMQDIAIENYEKGSLVRQALEEAALSDER